MLLVAWSLLYGSGAEVRATAAGKGRGFLRIDDGGADRRVFNDGPPPAFQPLFALFGCR